MLSGMPHDPTDTAALFHRLIQAASLVEARLEEAVSRAGLSLAKLGVLQHLVEAGEPLPLGQLAERIACVKSNVTQLVDRLEAEGLVRRETDSEDRRIVRAVITAEGRVKYVEAARARAEAEQRLAGAIPAELRPGAVELLAGLARVAASDS
jgi:DNA-binding MarR family transcriptional regulator